MCGSVVVLGAMTPARVRPVPLEQIQRGGSSNASKSPWRVLRRTEKSIKMQRMSTLWRITMSDEEARGTAWPADNPAVTAHVNLLQSIINRLANNSSSCKTWCLTLVGALLSLAGATHVPAIVTFALVPVVVFGFLDTMYLAQEKAYRELYNRKVDAIHGGSYAREDLFDATACLNIGHFGDALVSWSIWPVYFSLIVAYVVASCLGWIALLGAVPKTS
jgi:hypothetical protein